MGSNLFTVLIIFIHFISALSSQNVELIKLKKLENKIKILNNQLLISNKRIQYFDQKMLADSILTTSKLNQATKTISNLSISIDNIETKESEKLKKSEKNNIWIFCSSLLELLGSILLAIHLLKSKFEPSFAWYCEPKLHSNAVEFQTQSNDTSKIAFFGLFLLIIGFAIQLFINIPKGIFFILVLSFVLILIVYIIWELITSSESNKNFMELLNWFKRMYYKTFNVRTKCQVCLKNIITVDIHIGYINGNIGFNGIKEDKGLLEMVRVGHMNCIENNLPNHSQNGQGANREILNYNEFINQKTQLIEDLKNYSIDKDPIKSRIAKYSLKIIDGIE